MSSETESSKEENVGPALVAVGGVALLAVASAAPKEGTTSEVGSAWSLAYCAAICFQLEGMMVYREQKKVGLNDTVP